MTTARPNDALSSSQLSCFFLTRCSSQCLFFHPSTNVYVFISNCVNQSHSVRFQCHFYFFVNLGLDNSVSPPGFTLNSRLLPPHPLVFPTAMASLSCWLTVHLRMIEFFGVSSSKSAIDLDPTCDPPFWPLFLCLCLVRLLCLRYIPHPEHCLRPALPHVPPIRPHLMVVFVSFFLFFNLLHKQTLAGVNPLALPSHGAVYRSSPRYRITTITNNPFAPLILRQSIIGRLNLVSALLLDFFFFFMVFRFFCFLVALLRCHGFSLCSLLIFCSPSRNSSYTSHHGQSSFHCFHARHIAYDALRVSDINQHGTPFPLLGFLWLTGFVPPLSGVMLLIVTWVSFSTKSLMSRPALTGHPVLFWSLFTPFVVSNLVQGALCGINYWVYFIVMRVIISSWSALCIILSIFAGYYGTQTLKKISATKNSFNYAQQMRLLIFIIVMMICCSISLIFHAYFLTDIDLIPGVFFLITSVYRLSSFTVATGSAVYAWIATSHYISQSSHGSTSKSHSEGNRHSMIRSTSAAAASATAPRNVIVDSDDDSETSGETAALPADPASTPAIAHRQSDFDQPELSSTDEDEEEEEEEEEEEDE